MDDNNQEVYPMAPTHGQAKNDVESAARHGSLKCSARANA